MSPRHQTNSEVASLIGTGIPEHFIRALERVYTKVPPARWHQAITRLVIGLLVVTQKR
jgi:hypothetical protein